MKYYPMTILLLCVSCETSSKDETETDTGTETETETEIEVTPYGPDASSTAHWADTHQLTHPVLADAEKNGDTFAEIGGNFPTFPVIGPDMTIIKRDLFPPNESDLRALLESEGIW